MHKELLIIEDQGFLRGLYKELLEDEGFLVDTAMDGMGGLIKMLVHKYDIIYSDILHAYIDGFSMLEILNSLHLQQGRFIFLTDLLQEAIKEKAFKLGADNFLILSSITPDAIVDTFTEGAEIPPRRDQLIDNPIQPSLKLYKSMKDELYKKYWLPTVKKKGEIAKLHHYEHRILREVNEFTKRSKKSKAKLSQN